MVGTESVAQGRYQRAVVQEKRRCVHRDARCDAKSRSKPSLSLVMFITEIFKSIQGEGTRAGLPCIFVRLTGCNLRCTWCDTAYAFHGGTKLSVEEVISRVDELAGRIAGLSGSQASVPLVELTGGEPLLQEEVYPLAERLLAAGYTVMIETSGERYIGRLPSERLRQS